MLDNNLPVHTSRRLKNHTFSVVSEIAIKRMEDTKTDANKKNFKKHIDTLNKYHIPFFGKYTIREIDEKLLNEFDTWRENIMKRVPAKDTVKKHNVAMQRVFEAVIQKYITQTELPELTNNGRKGVRRAAFSKDEYKEIVEEAKRWIDEYPRKKTKAIREILYNYIQIAALTGIRPGTEMENLQWCDMDDTETKGQRYTTLIVRKGKTTSYTGTREIICKDDLREIIVDYAEFIDVCDLNDKMFNLNVAKSSDVFGKNFTKILKKLGLQANSHGKRTLYSLRHSYITWELQAGTDIQAIATQCGTSIEMIERHYSHVVPAMFANKLSGRKNVG